MARDSTIFPQAIGVASTWQPELAAALADAVRVQMRAMGAHQGLSPVLDICRDPRWGRTEETFGEDPHLVARMGVSFVRGLQGDDLTDGVIATAKHFVGYGASEGGLNWAPPHLGARELRDVYLHPFEAAVRSAGLRSVMNAYNELDGVPAAADRHLLTGHPARAVGIRAVASCRTTSRSASSPTTTASPPTPSKRRRWPSKPGSTSSCRGPIATASRCSRRCARAGCPRRPSTPPSAACSRTKFELGLFERPLVDPEDVAAVTATPGASPARRRDRPEVARAAAQRRHAAAAPGRGVRGGDRAQRRRAAPPRR